MRAVREFELQVPPELEGCTVEQALRRGLGLSDTRIKRAKFAPEGITLDGARVFTDHLVRAGQRLLLRLPDRGTVRWIETPGAVDIRYEDAWLMVVNKPAGLAVHPGPGHYADTLGNRLAWLFRQRGEAFAFHPVNRLDRGTSGLMLAAKRPEAHEALQGLLHTEDFVREYLALTSGAPEPARGEVDAPIAPVPGALNRYRVDGHGKAARTAYETLERRGDAALVRLRLYTGRTHQIRVHMAHLGCPLLGDEVYGGPPGPQWPALHSWRIRLRHPFTGQTLQWTAPLPAELRALGWEVEA